MAGDTPSPSLSPGPVDSRQPGAPAVPLALYRRYRPASFAEVKGQDHVTEPLRQALRSGRVHHAYLFSGPRGCGKTSSARILARSLNCESGPTPDPCGTCASCVALAPAGPGSIDVIEIDAASHGGVDDARDLRERAFYAPVSGRFKIYIIDEAHMVTGGGFNALLKLVEEPPPHLKFVFATTEPEKVIATIRSRTHHYPFRLVPPAILRELLEQILGSEGVAYEPAVLPVVIRAGAGSVRDSLSVLDQLIAGSDDSGLSYERAVALLGYTDDALLDDVAEAFALGDGAAVFRAIDRVVEGGHDPRRFAADLLDRFRDLIVLAAVPDAAASGLLDLPADRLERMRVQVAGFGPAQLASAAETISAGLVEMRGATSPRLMLELMCAQVLLPAPGTGEMAVLARLERLERRLGSGAGLAGSGGQVPPQPAGQTAAAAPGSAGRPPRPDSAGRPAGPDRAQTDVPKADVREDKAGNNGTSAQGVVPDAGRPAAGGTSPGTSGAKGKADTESIREQWAAVLDAVRLERRVAWLLLSNATVDSLADGVLTLRFGKEGEARGFAISGYDRDLGQVIQAMFGIAPQIRALAGPVQGPVAQARGTRGREGREPGAQGAGAQDAGSRDAGSQEAGSRDAGSHRAGSHGAGSQDAGSQDAGSHGRELPEAGSQGREPSGDGQPGRSAADSTRTGREATGGHEILSASAARSGGGTGTRRASPPSAASASRQSSGFGPGDQASDADIADMSDADALSGMDLVERELGGRIIEEIGEA